MSKAQIAVKAVGGTLSAGLGALSALRRRGSARESFTDRSIVITGGSRGLGLLLARSFAREGARLALLARDTMELEHAERDIAAHGGKALAIHCDVREQPNVQDAVEEVIRQYGRIDVLVNNAGVIQVGPVENMTVADFEEALDVYVRAPLYAMLAVAPHMRRQGGGRIVNISSIGGLVAIPHLVPYCTGKFGLVGLSDGMRAELARDNIRVTTVCPGLMRTGSHLNALFKGQQHKEFTLFALVGALPLTSMDARRAAHQIVEACRRGDPALTITIQARVLAICNALFPSTMGRLISLSAAMLPEPGRDDKAQSGWESHTQWAPSLLTRLSDRAAVANNELHRQHSSTS